MKTVLFVGAGRHQRRAIRQARERGLRVVAVDRNPDALGFEEADGRVVVVPQRLRYRLPILAILGVAACLCDIVLEALCQVNKVRRDHEDDRAAVLGVSASHMSLLTSVLRSVCSAHASQARVRACTSLAQHANASRVKALVTQRPPHRSGREGFPHPVPQ